MARDALASGPYDALLLVAADELPDDKQLMNTRLSILSDGAAAVVVSATASPAGTRASRINAVETEVGTDDDLRDPAWVIWTTMSPAQRAQAALDWALGADWRERAGNLFANHHKSSQVLLCSALGRLPVSLILGVVEDYAHGFSADILVTIDLLARRVGLRPGHLHLASANGPYT